MGLLTPTHSYRKVGDRIEIRLGDDLAISRIAWSDDRDVLFAAIKRELARQPWHARLLIFPRAIIAGDFSQHELGQLSGVIEDLGYARVVLPEQTAPQR